MAHPVPILAQSLVNFGQGIYLLIGLLIVGGLLSALLLAGVIVFRVWLFHRGQKLAREEYLQRTRRSDGKMYPPRGMGTCHQCEKIKKFVYYLPSGEQLCQECYDLFWPAAEERARQKAADREPVG